MAKRKRASLKDKSPESLGLTQKKSRGMDVLFGGSAAEDADAKSQPSLADQPDDITVDTPDSTSWEAGAYVSDRSDRPVDELGLPVAMDNPPDHLLRAAEHTKADPGGAAVDELGLPVAMDAPPNDLIRASEAVSDPTLLDDMGLANSELRLGAMPGSANLTGQVPPATAAELKGLVADEDSTPEAEDKTLANSETEMDLTGLVGSRSDTVPTKELGDLADGDDLSGLVGEEDISGLVIDEVGGPDDGMSTEVPVMDLARTPITGAVPRAPVSSAANDLSGLVADEDLSAVDPFLTTDTSTAKLPPTTAAPVDVPAPAAFRSTKPAAPSGPLGHAPDNAVPETGDDTAEYTPPVSPPPAPAPDVPPPSTATGAPDLSPRRSPGVEINSQTPEMAKTLSAFGQAFPDDPTAFLPQDQLPDYQLKVRETALAELDEAKQEEVLEFLGNRPAELFAEIERLHHDVETKLSPNKADVSFALESLLDASNILLEKPYQYEEALYRVSLVRTMIIRRDKLSRSSYGFAGIFVLVYGIVSTIIALWGAYWGLTTDFTQVIVDEQLGLIYQAIFLSGMAGLLGGAVEIFWRLYYRVSIKQDFDPQYLMYYIVKPILGFVLGLVMYFLVAMATTITGSTSPAGTPLPVASATTGFVLTLLLGFIAGYRQESAFDMIYVLIKRISPESPKAEPSPVRPLEDEELEKLKSDGAGSHVGGITA